MRDFESSFDFPLRSARSFARSTRIVVPRDSAIDEKNATFCYNPLFSLSLRTPSSIIVPAIYRVRINYHSIPLGTNVHTLRIDILLHPTFSQFPSRRKSEQESSQPSPTG